MSHRTVLVVVSFGSHALLELNLAATAAATDATVVVVDNFSDERERSAIRILAAEHGWQLVEAPNDGFGAGVNAGARQGIAMGCDVVVVLNPDLEVTGSTVDALAAHVRSALRTAVSPVIVRPTAERGSPEARSTFAAGGPGRTEARRTSPG